MPEVAVSYFLEAHLCHCCFRKIIQMPIYVESFKGLRGQSILSNNGGVFRRKTVNSQNEVDGLPNALIHCAG